MARELLDINDVRISLDYIDPYFVFSNKINTRLNNDELIEILRLARVGYDAEKKEREELEEALLKRGLDLVEAISDGNNAALLNTTTEDLKAIQFFVYTFKKLHCEKM